MFNLEPCLRRSNNVRPSICMPAESTVELAIEDLQGQFVYNKYQAKLYNKYSQYRTAEIFDFTIGTSVCFNKNILGTEFFIC